MIPRTSDCENGVIVERTHDGSIRVSGSGPTGRLALLVALCAIVFYVSSTV